MWTPKVQLEDNGPDINAEPEDMSTNVLSDGGGEWSAQTGGKLKCSNVMRSVFNEDTCFLSTDNSTCTSDGESISAGGSLVCGSVGEVANDPSLPEHFAINSEEEDFTSGDVMANQRQVIWTEIALGGHDQLRQR